MPPLCTAGYGLAIGNFSYFFGAFYLYSINCFFICISTFLIVKYLKYEPVRSLNPKFEKQIRYGITSLILIMIIPSFYLAYNLLNEKKYAQKVEQFISNEFTNKGYAIIYKNTKFNSNPKKIEVAFLNKKFNAEEIKVLNQKLVQYDISNTKLEIKQDAKDLKSEILNELNNQNKNLSEKDVLINNLQNELGEYKFDNSDIQKELKILFPELKNVSFGRHSINQNTDSAKVLTIVLYQIDNKKENVDIEKVKNWLNQKLKTTNVKLIKQE